MRHNDMLPEMAPVPRLRLAQRTWAPSQYPKRRLFVRSRKVSKPRDWYFKLSYRFEIWQAHRQHCCRSACQISERSDNSKYKSRGFETLRDLTKRRLFGYWDGDQVEDKTKFWAGTYYWTGTKFWAAGSKFWAAKSRVRLAGVTENAGRTCRKLSGIKRFFASRK